MVERCMTVEIWYQHGTKDTTTVPESRVMAIAFNLLRDNAVIEFKIIKQEDHPHEG